MLGTLYTRQKKFDLALEQYETITKKYRQYYEAFYMKGAVLEELGRKEEAVAAYKEFLDLVPAELNDHYAEVIKSAKDSIKELEAK